jgi:hypothetical protein
MKKFLSKNFLWFIAAGLAIFMLEDLKALYINLGRAQVQQEAADKITLITLQFEEDARTKSKLLERAVKERLDEKEKYKEELSLRNYTFQKYKEKTREEFQELKLSLAKVQTMNDNLRQDLIQTKALNLSLFTVNKNLLWNWAVSEKQLLRNFDNILKETTAATEQKYINFINKIDRIKKRLK